MLKISEFSKLTFVSVKTLRYYDEIGLLKPARIDPFTNYRYYSADQIPRLQRIMMLKSIGLSLSEIAQVLNTNPTLEELRGILLLKMSEVKVRMIADQEQLYLIQTRLQQLDEEGQMSNYVISLKSVPSVHVASIRGVAPNMAQIGQTVSGMFGELEAYVNAAGGQLSSDPSVHGITIYHDNEMMDENRPVSLETAWGLEVDVPETERVKVYELPPLELAASVVHHGSFANLHLAYGEIIQWIEQNQYEIVGANREISLQYHPTADPSTYVTEIQIPVRKLD